MPATPISHRLRPPPLQPGIADADRRRLPACVACNLPAFEAYLTPHNCRLCGLCHGRLLCLEDVQPCPGAGSGRNCQLASSFRRRDCRWDDEARLQLSSVFVKCRNWRLGCPYCMPYMKLETHEAQECQFTRVCCSGCNLTLLRRDLGVHQRSDECRQILIANIGNYGVPEGDN